MTKSTDDDIVVDEAMSDDALEAALIDAYRSWKSQRPKRLFLRLLDLTKDRPEVSIRGLGKKLGVDDSYLRRLRNQPESRGTKVQQP